MNISAEDDRSAPRRVLWEIGRGTSDVRTLRARLDLDSGYLSRLLRLLESEGLVTVEPAAHDGRVRVVRLTEAEQREMEVLDRTSDTLAESMLAPLNQDQRCRLVDAMATVRTLLTAGLVETTVEDPASKDAQVCVAQYFTELDERFDEGFDPALSISADIASSPSPWDSLWSPACAANRSGVPPSSSTTTNLLRSSACGSARPRLGRWSPPATRA